MWERRCVISPGMSLILTPQCGVAHCRVASKSLGPRAAGSRPAFLAAGDYFHLVSVSFPEFQAFTLRSQRRFASSLWEARREGGHGKSGSSRPRIEPPKGGADRQIVHENHAEARRAEKCQNEGRPRGVIENKREIKRHNVICR